MRYFVFLIFLLFAGCSTKVFEPVHTENKKLKMKTKSEELSEYTKKNLTFSSLILKKVKKTSPFDDGLKIVKVYYDENGKSLGKFKKIDEDMAVNGKKLLLISEKTVLKTPYLIYSATRKGDKIAIVFENGKYGVYDIASKNMSFIFDGDETLSVRHLHAKPLFYKDLILFPLLSGGIAVVDAQKGEFIRTLTISQNQFNDNVIFLKIVDNKLFMATSSKLILFDPKFLIDYEADIKHIVTLNKNLYVFTNDGDVIKLDSNLKELKKISLPYASFFAPGICKGNIWSVEKEGYLIKITPDLNVTVYEGNKFDTDNDSMLKIKGCKIYNDYKVFMIE